jgi:hypothetical protein
MLCPASAVQQPSSPARELEDLRQRVEELERQRDSGSGVDLAPHELASLDSSASTDQLARPWYENFELWGFGAFTYLDTVRRALTPEGGFLVKEATLFVQANVWEKIAFFCELQTNRLGEDEQVPVRTGEVYAHFRDLYRSDAGSYVGVKVGRVDIPFGDEYLVQDSIDDPLISLSAAYPYGSTKAWSCTASGPGSAGSPRSPTAAKSAASTTPPTRLSAPSCTAARPSGSI